MDELTMLIKQEIKKQYKSVRQFSMSIGVAQTTVVSALKNGVSGTGFSTVLKICKALGIRLIDFDTPIVMGNDAVDVIKKYSALDDMATHTVKTVLDVEYARCKAESDKNKIPNMF